jgi:hypothetical protein
MPNWPHGDPEELLEQFSIGIFPEYASGLDHP